MGIKITFTGDLMSLLPQNKAAFETYRKKNEGHGGYDYNSIFNSISYVLKDSDYLIGNLETPIAGEALGFTKDTTIFNTPKEFVDAIKNVGFDFLSTANNHCLDRKITGLRNTISYLKKINIDYSGTYLDSTQSEIPFIKEIGGVKIAILTYTYGTNSEWRNNVLDEDSKFLVDLFRHQDDYVGYEKQSLFVSEIKKYVKMFLPQCILEKLSPLQIKDCVALEDSRDSIYIERLKDKINRAKEMADIVIMYMHSGGQYNSEIGDYTLKLVDFLTRWGCDLVIGSHPHCVLKYEYVNKVFTAYSLGNFCFTPNYGYYYKGVYADYSIVLNIYVDQATKKVQKITFFVTKVVKKGDGNSVVYHAKDLCKLLLSEKKKKALKNDICNVISRFVSKTITDVDIYRDEFDIKEFD